jgi:hypothetical protein
VCVSVPWHARYAAPAPWPNGEYFHASLLSCMQMDTLHWQTVFRFRDFRSFVLDDVSGAIALSIGSAAGMPVRLVDEFDSLGIEGGMWQLFVHGWLGGGLETLLCLIIILIIAIICLQASV